MTSPGSASPERERTGRIAEAPAEVELLPAEAPFMPGLSVPPTLDDLRAALRPPALPLPHPTTVLGAAHRILDLSEQGRHREARVLSRVFAHEPAPMAERIELLRASALARRAEGRDEEAEQILREMVSLIDGAGYREHAKAAMLELGLMTAPAPGDDDGGASAQGSVAAADAVPAGAPIAPHSATDAGSASGPVAPAPSRPAPSRPARGRRRKDPLAQVTEDDVDEAVLAVVQGLSRPIPPVSAHLDESTLEAEEWRMMTALEAYPEAASLILGDPDPLLRLRLAEVLVRRGRADEAVFQARTVLEELAEREGRRGTVDVERSGTSAHTILAEALRDSAPALAASHAVVALIAMQDVDRPLPRIDLICELVEDLHRAGLRRETAFAARRLLSLLRTLPDPSDRVRALRVVAAERIHAGSPEEAIDLLAEARRIARADRDHRALLSIDRLSAEGLRLAGRPAEAIAALRRAATDARWLADDLGATRADRERFQRIELSVRGDVVRLALDVGLHDEAQGEAQGILVRLDRISGRPVLPASELWDHEVDARIGQMLAADLAAAARLDGERADKEAREEHARLRDEARRVIAAAPEGAQERRGFWEVYLADRETEMLDRLGLGMAALVAARTALAGWEARGEAEHAARVAELVARLEHAG